MNNLKIAVVFHSVCGNTCQLAQQLAESLTACGGTVLLRRLNDPGYAATADAFPASREYKNTILSIPVINSPAELLDCDGIIIGSPTYFGNVSAPVKTFMDSFVGFYKDAPFTGKAFGAFATSGTAQGGAGLCLMAINTFAMHNGMTIVPVPAGGEHPQPAYGLAHYSGDNSDIRLSESEKQSIAQWSAYFYRIAGSLAAGENA